MKGNIRVTGGNRKFSSKAMREKILKKRYLLRNRAGKIIETEEQMFRRVADTVAAAEAKYEASDLEISAVADGFYRLMIEGRFLPNSPTLMNAGRKNGMLSACFVLPVEDSIDGIFDAIKYTALIQKAGGGTGFSFDKLRPTGDLVSSSGGTTSGPISFWRIFAETTNAIQQGAHRRGANMGMMSLEHPDILKFITAKNAVDAFTNFNISVKVTNDFMEALDKEPDSPHIVCNSRTGKCYVIPKKIDIASYTINDLLLTDIDDVPCYTKKDIWEMVITNAYATGEPGVDFIDRINEDNPTPQLGLIEATNPCGEQPLLPFEACNLGSINVSKFINEERSDLDWISLAKTVEFTVRFLDDVIDINYYSIPKIKEVTLGNRKIGLGIMGFADTLILLGIRYDSEEAVEFAEKLASFIQEHAHKASEELGSFPNWEGSIWDIKHPRVMRNAACTTIAPTGTISIIAGCSSGIEPVFSFASRRKVLDEQEFIQIHPLIEILGTKEGWLTEKVRGQLAAGLPPKDIPQIPKELGKVLVTAHEISLEWHIRLQAAFQKHVDNAVSKTVNLPSTATVEDADKAFRLAYELGCKGTTIYVDNSRPNQVIVAANENRPHTNTVSPRPRARQTNGRTTKFRMGCGTLFVTVNKDKNGLCEVFANLGKAGGCPSQSEATCRAVSAALRCGVAPEVLIEQLKGIRCLSTMSRRKTNKDIAVLSCPDAVARAIEEVMGQNDNRTEISLINKCPDCGRSLRKEAGCSFCDNEDCGFFKCG